MKSIPFNADVKKVLRLLTNSIYTNKDSFIRELVSNASDACEKRVYLGKSNESFIKDYEMKIKIELDKDNKKIIFKDNGIGMTKEEMIENLGTIAKSGTEDFLNSKKDAEDLIGQFGVGFYSSFMVSNNVVVISRKVLEDGSVSKFNKWTSDGISGFEIEECAEQEKYEDYNTIIEITLESDEYLDRFKVENIINTYSDQVKPKIELQFFNEDKKENETNTLNNGFPIWKRDKSTISEEDYKKFYSSLSYQYGDPFFIIHDKFEGNYEFTCLLYCLSDKPFDLYNPNPQSRIKMYSKNVFIADDSSANIFPRWMRFLCGVIDISNFPLNVNRESLQNDLLTKKIGQVVTKKVLNKLKDLLNKDKEKYDKFWTTFGPVLKEGLCDAMSDKENLLEILLIKTTKSDNKFITLSEYVSRMKEGQDNIYYLTGENVSDMINFPALDVFIKEDKEVILFYDTVDSFMMQVVRNYKEKKFKSILDSDIPSSANEIKEEQQNTEDEKKASDLFLKALDGKVLKVNIKNNLSGPVSISLNPGAMDSIMERVLAEQKHTKAPSLKILNINLNNNLIQLICKMLESEDQEEKENGKKFAIVIFNIASIAQGYSVEGPAGFAKDTFSLMSSIVK